MNTRGDDFLQRLLATFKVEADEHLRAISAGLLELEKTPPAATQMELIETVFREVHSLKGAARAVNLTPIETVCQSLESLFAAWKQRELSPSPVLFDVLHEVVSGLRAFLGSTETGSTAAETSRLQALLKRLESASHEGLLLSAPADLEPGEASPPQPQWQPQPPLAQGELAVAEMVRIPTAKLDPLLLQAEELIAAKLTASQHAAGLRELNVVLAGWRKEWTKIRPEVRALQQPWERNGQGDGQALMLTRRKKTQVQMTKLLQFLEWQETYSRELESKLTTLAKSVEENQRTLGRMVDGLLEDMRKVLMLPFSSLLEGFPKLVRDLSRDRSKEVALVMHGGEIEADRRILEELKDPLVHLVRNCIDHGIEAPAERERKHKPPRGTIRIALAPRDGNRVELVIADDGAGIDVANVRSAALKLDMLSPQEAAKLGEPEVVPLIFQSGVSTSPMITELSGRGLGLAIVREKVEKLGGTVAVDTQRDAGTTFRLVLPLTLAALRGIVIRVGEHRFVVPTTHVERVVRVKQTDIKTVENRATIPVHGQAVSLVRLDDALELPRPRTSDDDANNGLVMVLAVADKRIAFVVDDVLQEQEVLMKRLGKQLSRVRNITGAAVLGTGQAVPILNVFDLIPSAVRTSGAGGQRTAAAQDEAAPRKSILVVEDSITARMLLRNILEASGYEVVTAVDGLDGFTKLCSGAFQLVVSDVDMPRMTGLDLTAKIRSDPKLAEVPVVLVTALESREDRERGIEVGANAYIVKQSFDQSNLLEVIRRLI
jgi:two-component system chemotaxis sensor kinase CheA